MKRIAPIIFWFVYDESVNAVGLNSAYNRIFELAFNKMKLDKESTKEYSGRHGRNRDLPNTRRGGKENES